METEQILLLGLMAMIICVTIAVCWGVPYEIKQSELRIKSYIDQKFGSSQDRRKENDSKR